MRHDISKIRKEYAQKHLDITDVDKKPLITFKKWLEEAIDSKALEPNAMNLASISKFGIPSNRIVLLKKLDNGFVFFTNYQSNKGLNLENNPLAALTFFWPELERQVRIQGITERVSETLSTEYFQSRPKNSQIGAWVSPQSCKIKNREILEQRMNQLKKKHLNDKTLPKPKQWGGYRVVPFSIEFWQGRPNRVHDRILCTLEKDDWRLCRLAP